MSYRKVWPVDRVQRFDALRAQAKSLGIRMSVERWGRAAAPMFRIVATDRQNQQSRFYDLSKAETWIAGRVGHIDIAAQQIANLIGTNPASMAAFKSKTLALIETLHLPDEAVVGLGLSLAVSHAITSGMDRETLGHIVDGYFEEADKALANGVANDR